MVPLLLILFNKQFGISSSLRHICAACIPFKADYFRYNWRLEAWSLWFVIGIALGGLISSFIFPEQGLVDLNPATLEDLSQLGLTDFSGILPVEIFAWDNLFTLQGMVFIVLGGFLVGFGSRYANGCTSGHGIMGLSNLQKSSLFAIIGFFIGGLFITFAVLPFLV
jgi:uncharacterized membrane protein YedE/YeeE